MNTVTGNGLFVGGLTSAVHGWAGAGLQFYDPAAASAHRKLKFLPVAEAFAALSKDRSTKVGAIVLDDDLTLLSAGYNGFPRGVSDNVDQRHTRPDKYLWTAHAEENAISQAARTGTALLGATIVITSLYPCARCARQIVQSGIKTVLVPECETTGQWLEEWQFSKTIFKEGGVSTFTYDPKDPDRDLAQL